MQLIPEQFARLSQLFDEAVDLSPPERQALIEGVRRREGDEMADELAGLLKANDEATDTMDQPLVQLPQLAASEGTYTFREGEVILRRFRVVRVLGRGGMGEVYEAQDQELGPVALKTIRRDLIGDRAALRRFKQEVQLARKVTSPYVCRIHELFTLPDNGQHRVAAFLTMELLEGATLAKRIEQGPLPWREAEPIFVELCQGLEALHAVGLVHRDFKPGNAMLAKRGNVMQAVVMDFGLALRSEESLHGRQKLTGTGGIIGTPGYMAPEQFEGGTVSPATDIYTLGMVLYEMVTGKRPFEASTPLAEAVRRAKRPPAASSIQPGLPRRVDRVIEKCLKFEPADRFQTAGEVAKALRGDAAEVIGSRMPSWATRSRRRAMAVVLVLALAALIAAGILRERSFHHRYKPSEAALAWYTKGLDAFREGTYLKAEGLFQSALDADKAFGLARVHLAEAWNELDFKGNADEAMAAVTPQQEDGMGSADRDYAEAVRATLRQDFSEARAGFKKVLDHLPEGERAAGNVDLGRIEEKAGNIPSALDAYHAAIKLAPNSPAAYLRSAVLESRQGSNTKAAADFDSAYALFTKLGALEGNAEVAYQRSYWQSVLGNYDTARKLAQQSLDAALNMTEPSVQLQVRAICRFSAIDHGKGDDDEALEEAARAIALAHDNGMEYWETDALLRQGAAYYGKKQFAKAEECATKALNVANRSRWPRLIALAQLNLAFVRDMRLQNQDIPGLTTALDYYKRYQFPKESLIPLLLLVRQKNNQSQFESGRQSGIALLSFAADARNVTIVAQAEEAVGTSYFGLQQYPEALAHFEASFGAAVRSNYAEIASYQMLHRAETLGCLGQIEEAEHLLAQVKDENMATEHSRIRARLLSMQGRYSEAIEVTRRALAADPGLNAGAAADFRIAGLLAAAKSGALDQARVWAREAADLAQKAGVPETVADVSFAQAVLNLAAGSPQKAKYYAETALTFFETHGQKESEWLTLYHLARIEKALGSKDGARQEASKSLAILSVLEHNWTAQAKLTYERRPDVSAAVVELRQIVGK